MSATKIDCDQVMVNSCVDANAEIKEDTIIEDKVINVVTKSESTGNSPNEKNISSNIYSEEDKNVKMAIDAKISSEKNKNEKIAIDAEISSDEDKNIATDSKISSEEEKNKKIAMDDTISSKDKNERITTDSKIPSEEEKNKKIAMDDKISSEEFKNEKVATDPNTSSKENRNEEIASMMVIHIPSSQGNVERFKCSSCKAIFLKYIEATNHYKLNHIKTAAAVPAAGWRNNIILPKPQTVGKYLNGENTGAKLSTEDDKTDKIARMMVTVLKRNFNGKPFKCSICKIEFFQFVEATNHIKLAHMINNKYSTLRTNTIVPKQYVRPIMPNSMSLPITNGMIPVLPNSMSSHLPSSFQIGQPILNPFQRGVARERQQAQTQYKMIQQMKIDQLLSRKSSSKKLPNISTPSGLLESLFPAGRPAIINPLEIIDIDIDDGPKNVENCDKQTEDISDNVDKPPNDDDIDTPPKDWGPAECAGFPSGWKWKVANAWSRRTKFMSPENKVFNSRIAAAKYMDGQDCYTKEQAEMVRSFEENSKTKEIKNSSMEEAKEEFPKENIIEAVEPLDILGEINKQQGTQETKEVIQEEKKIGAVDKKDSPTEMRKQPSSSRNNNSRKIKQNGEDIKDENHEQKDKVAHCEENTGKDRTKKLFPEQNKNEPLDLVSNSNSKKTRKRKVYPCSNNNNNNKKFKLLKNVSIIDLFSDFVDSLA